MIERISIVHAASKAVSTLAGHLVDRPVFLVLACWLASGCQTTDQPVETAMSLEEAKALTAEFEASDFTPPQRTISDFRSSLPTNYPADPNCEPDSFEFDPERSKPISRSDRHRIVANEANRAWAVQAFRWGNFPKAIELVTYARDVLPANWNLPKGTTGMQLARYHAIIGERARAERLYSEGDTQFRKGQSGDPAAYKKWKLWFDSQVWATRGIMAFVAGRYREAELSLRKAIQIGVNPVSADYNILQYHLIWAIERQGRLDEAEAKARNLMRYRAWGPTSDGALSIESLARILLSQGRYEDAEWLAKIAVRIYRYKCIPDRLFFPSLANLRLAQALVGQKKWEEALELFETLEASTRDGKEQVYQNKLLSNPDWGIAFLATDRSAEAAEILKHTAKIVTDQFGPESYQAIEAVSLRDLALAQSAEACIDLEQQAENLMRLATERHAYGEGAGLSTVREQRLAFLVNAYLSLTLKCSGKRELVGVTADRLFEIAQIGRGGQVQAALSANAARAAAASPDLADLVRQFQDAENGQRELSRIIAYRLSLPSGEVDGGTTRKLQERQEALRSAAAALSVEIERDFPDYARLVGTRPIGAAEIRANLHPGEAVLFIRVAESESYVWALPKGGETRLAVVELGRQEIGEMVAGLRQAVDPPHAVRTLGEIPAFDVDLAHALYATLLEPVEPGWAEASSLLVVADGELQQLPFSLLVTEPADPGADKDLLFAGYRDVPWLARSHAVTTLPSVSALTTLRGLPPSAETRHAFAGFGDPLFSADQALAAAGAASLETGEVTSRGTLATRGLPVRLRSLPQMEGIDSAQLAMLPRLPDTAEEVNAMALAMNADLTRDVFTGQAANEGAVKTLDLSGYKVLAFATHALVPGELDGLTQPALALSAPEVAEVEGDGLLTMGEILGLKLDADWVVLSACNTAAGEGAGAEAVSGLGRAFFYAGARALLVSNWPVETTSARELTTDIFRRQAVDASLSRADALQQAMVALIDGPGFVDGAGNSVFSYAHPIFWAPFTLVGDGGSGQPSGF